MTITENLRICLLLLAFMAGLTAQAVVDQSAWVPPPSSGFVIVGTGEAQTFTAGFSGKLTQIDISFSLPNGPAQDLDLLILPTDGTATPLTATPLGQVAIPAAVIDADPGNVFVDVESLDIGVTAGTKYTFWLRRTGGGVSNVALVYGLTYLRGDRFSVSGAGTPSSSLDDLSFRTWVRAAYQINGRASLDFDGIQTDGSAPATSRRGTNQLSSLNFGGAVAGNAAELILALRAPVARLEPGGLELPSGEIININLADPTTFFLQGGLAPDLSPLPGGTIPLPLLPAGFEASAQMIAIDFTAPGFLSVSQAGHLQVRDVAIFAGPTGDDSTATITLPPLSDVPFYGTLHSEIHVSSNGRVTFGAPDSTYAASVPAALAGPDWVGFWTDLQPNVTGNIEIHTSPDVVEVRYNSVPYYQELTTVTFSIAFNLVDGSIAIDSSGIAPNPLTNTFAQTGDAQLFGIGRGNGLGTDGGPFSVLFGNLLLPNNATDINYDFWDGTPAATPGGIGLVQILQNVHAGGYLFTFQPICLQGTQTYAGALIN